MEKKERITEGQYATIYELKLHETTLVHTEWVEGKNTYNCNTQTWQVTRVFGGWIYSRYAGTYGPQEHFVPDTRGDQTHHSANRPR